MSEFIFNREITPIFPPRALCSAFCKDHKWLGSKNIMGKETFKAEKDESSFEVYKVYLRTLEQ